MTAAVAERAGTFHCQSCGPVMTTATTEHGYKVARGRHKRGHERRLVLDLRLRQTPTPVPAPAPQPPVHRADRRGSQIAAPNLMVDPAQRVLARHVSLRLSVVTAIHRIGMWQACPAMDQARNADQVLEEVRVLLEATGR